MTTVQKSPNSSQQTMSTTPEQTGTTALVVRKREVGGLIIPEVITDASDFNTAVGQWRGSQKFNLLTPITNLSNVPEWHSVVFTEVRLDPNPDMKDVYRNPLFCKGDEVAISAAGLAKIALAANMETWAVRVDSGTVPYLWEFEGHAKFLSFDGTPIHISRRKEWDLREGSFQLKGMKPPQVEEARKHGAANAESRAINRAIRQYGIKQVYKQKEVANPFIVAKLAFTPPLHDPEVKRFYMALKMGKEAMLFGAAAGALPPAVEGADPLKLPPDMRPATEVKSLAAKDDDDIPFEDEPGTSEPQQAQQQRQIVLYRARPDNQGGTVWRDRANRYFTRVQELGETKLYVESLEVATAIKDIFQAGHLIGIETEKRGEDTWILEVSDGGAA